MAQVVQCPACLQTREIQALEQRIRCQCGQEFAAADALLPILSHDPVESSAWKAARTGVNLLQAGTLLNLIGSAVFVYLLITQGQGLLDRPTTALKLAVLAVLLGWVGVLGGQVLSWFAPVPAASPFGLAAIVLWGLGGLLALVGGVSGNSLASNVASWCSMLSLLAFGYFQLRLAASLENKQLHKSWQSVLGVVGIAIVAGLIGIISPGIWIASFTVFAIFIFFVAFLIALSQSHRAFGKLT
jgi:hypothetical protein